MPFPALAALLPALAPLLGGLLGGGSSGAQGAQQAASSPDLAALAPALAAVGARSSSPGAIGAAAPQGPSVGEQVGASAAGAFLASQLARQADRPDPAAQAGLQELGRTAAAAPILDHQSATARALVRQVVEQLGPELGQIRRMAQERATQIQATVEHREIVARETFRREVLEALRRIERGQQSAQRTGAGRRY